MSNADWNEPGRAPASAPQAPGQSARDTACGAERLRGPLQQLVDQISDADRRHAAILAELQQRLAALGNETRSSRHRLPVEYTTAFERIKDGIAEVTDQVGEAGRSRGMSDAATPALKQTTASWPDAAWPRRDQTSSAAEASAIDTFDVVESSVPGSVAHPWDQESAEALARLYGSGETSLAPSATSSAGQCGPAPSEHHRPSAALHDSDTDRTWLDTRLSDMARRLEKTLAEMRPESSVTLLSERFERLEERLASALANVATRVDVEGVRLIEAHVSEIAAKLEQTRSQLARLDSIEFNVAALIERLSAWHHSDQAGGPAFDIERVATVAAEQVARRGLDQAEQVRLLVDSFMAERRRADEHVTATLDTLQEAMVSVLDRIDALGFTQRQPFGRDVPDRTETEAPLGAETTVFASTPTTARQARRFIPDAPALSLAEPYASPFAEADDEPEFSPYGRDDWSAPPEESDTRPPRTLDRIRQELIADAQRAKLRAVMEAAEDSGSKRASAGTGKAGTAPSKSRLAGFGALLGMSNRKLLLSALVLFLLSSGAFLLMLRKPVTPGKTAASESTVLNPAERPALQPMSGTSIDHLDLESNGTTDVLRPPRDTAAAATPTPLGIILENTPEISGEELARVRQHRDMAILSTKLGIAAQPTPVALGPAHGSEFAATAVDEPNAAAGASRPLDMPPATVGPLSLRLAAAKGDPSAEFEVAVRLAGGKGTDQSFEEAVRWYQRSAMQGFQQAQYRLGTHYERGLGIETDLARARIWYGRAAEQGNIKAMHNLAVLSAGRDSGSPDYALAVRWFAEAAKRGLADSQYNLAVLYENGLGVPKDLGQAYIWFALSARSGDAEAARRRDVVRASLDPADIVVVDETIRAFAAVAADPLANDPQVAGEAWKTRQQSTDGT